MASIASKKKVKKDPKKYKIYKFDEYDHQEEEGVTAFLVLSLISKEELVNNLIPYGDTWFSGVCEMELKKILQGSWSKEDVDRFVQENEECWDCEFSIHDESENWPGVIKYKSTAARRNFLLNKILDV